MSQQPRTRDEFDFLDTSGPSDTDESDFEDGASVFNVMSEADFTRVEEECARPAQPRARSGPRIVYAEAPNGFDETLEEEKINDVKRGCSRHLPDPPKAGKEYYIVTSGRICGVFNNWSGAHQQTSGHSHFSVKKAEINTKDGAYQEWDRLYAQGLVGGPNSSYRRIPPYYEGDPPPAPVGGRSSQPPRAPGDARTNLSTATTSARHTSQEPRTPTRASREPSPSKTSASNKAAREQMPSTPRSRKLHSFSAASTPTSSRFTAPSTRDSAPSTPGPSTRRNEAAVPSSVQRVVYHNFYEARANSQRNGVDVLCFNRYDDAEDALAKYVQRDGF